MGAGAGTPVFIPGNDILDTSKDTLPEANEHAEPMPRGKEQATNKKEPPPEPLPNILGGEDTPRAALAENPKPMPWGNEILPRKAQEIADELLYGTTEVPENAEERKTLQVKMLNDAEEIMKELDEKKTYEREKDAKPLRECLSTYGEFLIAVHNWSCKCTQNSDETADAFLVLCTAMEKAVEHFTEYINLDHRVNTKIEMNYLFPRASFALQLLEYLTREKSVGTASPLARSFEFDQRTHEVISRRIKKIQWNLERQLRDLGENVRIITSKMVTENPFPAAENKSVPEKIEEIRGGCRKGLWALLAGVLLIIGGAYYLTTHRTASTPEENNPPPAKVPANKPEEQKGTAQPPAAKAGVEPGKAEKIPEKEESKTSSATSPTPSTSKKPTSWSGSLEESNRKVLEMWEKKYGK